jgi:hypothetical protein
LATLIEKVAMAAAGQVVTLYTDKPEPAPERISRGERPVWSTNLVNKFARAI